MKIESVIDLPITVIQPINQRIFCISFSAEEIKTKSGIILPGAFQNQEGKSNQKIDRNRYLVAAVANDITIKTKSGRKIQRGDEIYPIQNPDAVEVSWPEIIDFNNGNRFIVMHESELFGTVECPGTIEEKFNVGMKSIQFRIQMLLRLVGRNYRRKR